MEPLDALEAQSINILREAYAEVKNLGLLWSLEVKFKCHDLANPAFFRHVPFPCVHVDTGKNFLKCTISKSLCQGMAARFNRWDLSAYRRN